MHYNKYILALALLVSSVFSKQDELAKKLKTVIGNHKKFTDIPETELAGIFLSQNQKNALAAVKDISVEGAILEALNEVERVEEEEAEKAKTRRVNLEKDCVVTKVTKILAIAKEGKITDKPFEDYEGTFLKKDQYTEMKEHETRLKRPLTADELENYYTEGRVPDDTLDKTISALAEKIKSAIPDGGRFADLKEADLAELNLTSEQKQALKKADPKKDSDILSILKSAKVHDSTDKSKNRKDAWYNSNTALIVSGVLIIAAVSGGVYIMTRKINETEL